MEYLGCCLIHIRHLVRVNHYYSTLRPNSPLDVSPKAAKHAPGVPTNCSTQGPTLIVLHPLHLLNVLNTLIILLLQPTTACHSSKSQPSVKAHLNPTNFLSSSLLPNPRPSPHLFLTLVTSPLPEPGLHSLISVWIWPPAGQCPPSRAGLMASLCFPRPHSVALRVA